MPSLADSLPRSPHPPPQAWLQRPLPAWLQRPAAAIILTAGVHGLLLVVLLEGDRQRLPPRATSVLEVQWILSPPEAYPVPPMPQAPRRGSSERVSSPAVDTPRVRTADNDIEEVASPRTEPTPAPQARPLSAQIGAFAREATPAAAPTRNLLERPAQALPGREDALVEGFHVREETSPADRVQAVLSLVGLGGGGGATCSDLRRKITSDISDAERRKLIDDERRICRRGRAGTYR